MIDGERFERLLAESVRLHGHLCPGQVLGVRLALCGLEKVGLPEPKGKDRGKLLLFVEIDRCATDALQSVTGCSLGHRNLRFLDYGKMAASFVNLETQQAVRVAAREEAREKAGRYFPHLQDRRECQRQAYSMMPDRELFSWKYVRITVLPQDLPGKPLRRVRCEACGEMIQDMREVVRDGRTFCAPCAFGGAYYRVQQTCFPVGGGQARWSGFLSEAGTKGRGRDRQDAGRLSAPESP
ncbi:MAG: FmdE family protein [Desulfobacterota bacterium]|jgi:formylmethanofuran dehydrogenase subunit E|nr:FmdE family protein [Thermodesulfobacteriota bacterium]